MFALTVAHFVLVILCSMTINYPHRKQPSTAMFKQKQFWHCFTLCESPPFLFPYSVCVLFAINPYRFIYLYYLFIYLYHLESRWRNSHLLVYHGPLRSHLLGVAPSTFTYGVYYILYLLFFFKRLCIFTSFFKS